MATTPRVALRGEDGDKDEPAGDFTGTLDGAQHIAGLSPQSPLGDQGRRPGGNGHTSMA